MQDGFIWLLAIALLVGGAVTMADSCTKNPRPQQSDIVIRCNYALYGCMEKIENEKEAVREKLYQGCMDLHKNCVNTFPVELIENEKEQ